MSSPKGHWMGANFKGLGLRKNTEEIKIYKKKKTYSKKKTDDMTRLYKRDAGKEKLDCYFQ